MSNGLDQIVTPNEKLAAIVGPRPKARKTITKKFWEYVKDNNLQDPSDGRRILAGKDDDLRRLAGKDVIGLTEVGGIIAKNVDTDSSLSGESWTPYYFTAGNYKSGKPMSIKNFSSYGNAEDYVKERMLNSQYVEGMYIAKKTGPGATDWEVVAEFLAE